MKDDSTETDAESATADQPVPHFVSREPFDPDDEVALFPPVTGG